MRVLTWFMLSCISMIVGVIFCNIELVQAVVADAGINQGTFMMGTLLLLFLINTSALVLSWLK